jgi:aspartate/methionine/tyrosine aminotransferase
VSTAPTATRLASAQWIAQRARSLEPVAVHETNRLVAEIRNGGADVIDLYGSPYWLPPEHVLEAARAAVYENASTPAAGLPRLLAAGAARLSGENGFEVDPSTQLVVTNAANHGLAVLFTTVLDPGDEVLTFSPHYYYQGIVEIAGGALRYAQTSQADGWAWDHEALRAAVTARTKVVLVNTPTNPTGYVATRSDLQSVVDLAAEHDLLIVSDEAYDHTVYDGETHLSIAALSGAAERTVTVLSATKSYAMRHWRIGMLAGPAEVIARCRNVLEWNVFACNHVAQHALWSALSGPQDWVAEIGERFTRCRDLLMSELEGAPGLAFVKPRGGPFLFVEVRRLKVDADGFRSILLRKHGVPTDPGRYFGSATHLRLPFGGQPDDVREAGRRIHSAAMDQSLDE